MRWLCRLALVGLFLSPLALAGCKQGVGDRCQVDTDCDDGLHCILPAGGTPQAGGTCQTEGATSDMMAPGGDMPSPTRDLSTAGDLSSTD